MLLVVLLAACVDPAPPSTREGVLVGLHRCPAFGDGHAIGQVAAPALDELSGLAASRAHPGTWWAHNDSGDGPHLYALDDEGRDLGRWTLHGADAHDWQDLAAGPGPDGPALYVADIGDNPRVRDEVVVWRAPEPAWAPSGASDGGTLPADAFTLTYPDGPHDAETLLVDPIDGTLVIVTRSLEGSGVYATGPSPAPGRHELTEVARLPFGHEALPGVPLATGGDVSPSGDRVVVRTYGSAYLWGRVPGRPLVEAFAGDPCPIPMAFEGQGEAVAWDPSGRAYVAISEGPHPDVVRYEPR